jgi:hypothetical protein
MAKSLGQLEVLGANIEDLAGRGAREKVMQGQETLTEKSKPEVIAEWVRGAMERLDAAVDQPAREKIMLHCGLLRALPQDEVISKTYCQCSRGFVQKWWQGILEYEVEVDLLETAVSGASECKFAIHLK